jgi:uncharacterized protein YoxC
LKAAVTKMTWEIALGIFALVGFVISLVSIAAKVNGTLTKLETTLQNLQKTMDDFKESNDKSKSRIWEKLDEHSDMLTEHDKEIALLRKGA